MDLFYSENVKPMLAEKGELFDSDDYIYEIKWDGIRCIAYLDNGSIRLKSRNNLDITTSYPEFSALPGMVLHKPVILDGEIIILKNGRPSFHEWQKRGQLKDPARIAVLAKENPAIFVAFDILYEGGKNLIKLPLVERKDHLEKVVIEGPSLAISTYVQGSGTYLYKLAEEQDLEGIMAKKADSPYLPGKRSRYWLKIKRTIQEDFVVCGYLPGHTSVIGSLILGAYRRNKLAFQGLVGTGFTQEEILKLHKLFQQYPGSYPFSRKIPELANAVWVEPRWVCTVEYLEKSETGIRHPSYKGMRFDKDPKECVQEGSFFG